MLLMLLGAAVVTMAYAQNPSGNCGKNGNNLTWELNLSTNTLIISGSGEMADYSNSTPAPWRANEDQILYLDLPNGMTNIGRYAFAQLDELTSVSLPNSVKTIERYAFYSCDKLANLNLNKVEEIGEYAFHYCDALAEVTIPGSVESINYRAFYYSGIKHITIPNTVTFLDQNVFEHSELETLVLSSTITTIPANLCLCCYKLKSVTIPEGVKTIGEAAFSSCTALETLVLPSTMKVIDASFSGCSGLTSITCKAVEPPAAHNEVFDGVPKDIPVYVPAGSVNAYKSESKWEVFGDNIQAISGTAIDVVVGMDAKVQKFYQNGQLYILRNGQRYDATGKLAE